jgi:hypothetical protein
MKKIQITTTRISMVIISMLLLISACTKKSTPTPVPTPKPEITPIKKTESQAVYYYRYLNNGYSNFI